MSADDILQECYINPNKIPVFRESFKDMKLTKQYSNTYITPIQLPKISSRTVVRDRAIITGWTKDWKVTYMYNYKTGKTWMPSKSSRVNVDKLRDVIYVFEDIDEKSCRLYALDFNFDKFGTLDTIIDDEIPNHIYCYGCLVVDNGEKRTMYKYDGSLIKEGVDEAGFTDDIIWELIDLQLTVNGVSYTIVRNTHIHYKVGILAFTTNNKFVWVTKHKTYELNRRNNAKLENLYRASNDSEAWVVSPFGAGCKIDPRAITSLDYDVLIQEVDGGIEIRRLSNVSVLYRFYPGEKLGNMRILYDRGFSSAMWEPNGVQLKYYSYTHEEVPVFKLENTVIQFSEAPRFIYQDNENNDIANYYLVHPFQIEKLTILEQLDLLESILQRQ